MADGYLSRPCIDNLNLECPPTSPNAVDYCEIIRRWRLWKDKAPKDQLFDLEKEEVPKSRAEVEKRTFANIEFVVFMCSYLKVFSFN